MVDTKALKIEIIKNDMSVADVYTSIGLSPRQWYERIEKKRFDSDEMYKLVKLLKIDNPVPIFFADEVTR